MTTNRSFVKLTVYSTYITNHPAGNGHGSSAAIIKNSLKHYKLFSYDKDFLQAATILVDDDNIPFSVSAIYCPPRHRISKEQYSNFFSSILVLVLFVVVTGIPSIYTGGLV